MKIKCRFTAKVIFECDAESIRIAAEKAVEGNISLEGANLEVANLEDANLRDANLRDANLEVANLRGADLEDANLTGANLVRADLRGANLEDANLEVANLEDANLEVANLRGADLRGANLTGANLTGADLRGANLEDANLQDIKSDYFKVLSVAKKEVIGLYKSLMEGKINGSTYSGECACLVGTIAKIRHEEYDHLKIDLSPDSCRPAEQWFLAIRTGDTPANHAVSKLTVEWTKEFAKAEGIALPEMRIEWSDGKGTE